MLAHDFQMQFRKWQSCNPLVLFEADIEKYCPENFVDIKKTLEREVRQCQALVIWTDCDREGENIGFEIIHVCRAVKPDLPVLRARFSEITSRAVQAACENLTEPDQRVSDAVDVRQELDLRIGAAFTRFQTLRLQKVFPEVLAEQLVSYGSCQFPTLGFVVERFKAIQAFVPEVFHKIRVTHDHRDGVVEFSWKRHRLFSHTACLVLYQLCMEDPRATVVEVRSKARSKWRPQALDTVELEKLASRKLRINAKETMRIAERLYTQGYISYPRCGVVSVVAELMESSITAVCTSRFCTCCSNLSITAETFCRSMVLSARSRALVTCAMFFVTPFMVTAVCTLEATASTRDAMRSQFTPSFFLRMAFSAYTRAHSTFFC